MNKKIVIKSNDIRGINHKRILQFMSWKEEITRLELAYRLKISIPDVASNVNEMIKAGVIEETDSDEYAASKAPKVIRLKPDSRVSIGIGITKDKVAVTVMNLLHAVLLKEEKIFHANDFLQYIKEAKRVANELLEKLNIEDDRVLGVGISIPGLINTHLEIAEYTNMGYKEIKLSDINALFDCSVYIENEENLSLIAERVIGHYEKLDNLLYIGINEGVGAGILVNGELFTGANGRAGEIGHMHVSSEIDNDENSIEDYISVHGLIKRYNKRACMAIQTFSEFEQLIEEKDYVASGILNEGIAELMVAIYNLTLIFDPQKIIIGGMVGRLIKNQDIDTFFGMHKYKNFVYQINTDIVFSNIKQTVTIGAALLPIIDFYKINSED